jgi:hypothetical protein
MISNYNGKTSSSSSVKTYISNVSLNNTLWSTSSLINDSSINQNVIVPASPYYSNLYIPGDLYLDGNFINASDIQLKTNLKNICQEENIKILNLNAYSYTFKHDLTNKKHYGLIAQEVEEEFPELVITKPDINNNNENINQNNNDDIINYKGVNYLEIVPLLVDAIKKQQKQINELQNKLNTIIKKF